MTATDYTLTIGKGTETVTLTSGILDYIPMVPDGWRNLPEEATITEQARLKFSGAAVANALETIRNLENLFVYAAAAQGDPSKHRVYVNFKTTTSADEYRSEIVDGWIFYDRQALKTAQWTNNTIIVQVNWVRRYYWEGPETQIGLENPASTAGAPTTSGTVHLWNPQPAAVDVIDDIVIFDNLLRSTTTNLALFDTPLHGTTIRILNSASNDGTHIVSSANGTTLYSATLSAEGTAGTVTLIGYSNWSTRNWNYVFFTTEGTANKHVLPSPVRIELTNADAPAGTANATMIYHIGHTYETNLYTGIDIYDYQHILEAEDNTGGFSVDAEDVDCSNGYRSDYTTTTAAEEDAYLWSIGEEMNKFAGGRYYRVLGRFSQSEGTADITAARYRLKWTLNGDIKAIVWSGAQVQPSTSEYLSIVDLGTIKLPPYDPPDGGNVNTTDLVLTVQRVSSDVTIGLDCLYLMPLDGYVKIESVEAGTAQDQRMVYDGISHNAVGAGIAWTDNGTTAGVRPNTIVYGKKIMVVPEKTNALLFAVHSDQAYTAEIWRHMTVKVYYRPRRVAL